MSVNVNLAYVNSLWNQSYQTLNWFNSQPYSQSLSPFYANLSQQSILSAVDAIGTVTLINSLIQQAYDLTEILALPIDFGSAGNALYSRLQSIQTIYPALQALLPPNPSQTASSFLSSGQPSISYSDYVSFYSSYGGETFSLYGLSGIQLNTSQWASATNILGNFYQNNPPRIYDTLSAISLTANQSLEVIQDVFSNSSFSLNPDILTYNQMYSLPSTITAANILSLNLGLVVNQEYLAARHSLIEMANLIQQTFLIAQAPLALPPISTVTVMGNETLQDIASRNLGNFELWEQIASINGIIPGSNLIPGQQLFLPPIAPVGQTAINYAANVLGRDINYGPLNGEIPKWNGDFQTTIGINNLIGALGRRLQTSLGSFTFHTNYGSRIPPEIGQVQTVGTAGHIAAFGKSALLSDPRVAAVSNVSVSSGQSPGTLFFQATITPIGPNQNPVQINEVLSPL